MATADGHGTPLDEYTKVTPPGWAPHMQNYPLRLYLEKLRLWLRITDLQDRTKIGPTIVGRLTGAAYRLVMKMRLVRQNRRVLTGDEAVAAFQEPEIPADPQAGHPYVPEAPSGVDVVISTLQGSSGALEHDQQALALERFFGLYRGSQPVSYTHLTLPTILRV